MLRQTCKDYEYIVIDGGSTDGSNDLIRAFADKLSYWVSEEDKGVYHAMNKGIRVAKGEYLLFLNSGDYLTDDCVFEYVVGHLDDSDIIYGDLLFVEGAKSYVGFYPSKLSFTYFVEGSLPHPGSFIKRKLFEEIGCYDESLKICSDWKFFLDAICRYNVTYKHIEKTIAAFYLDGLSSKPENVHVIEEEKRKVLNSCYPMFMELYKEYRKLNPIPVKRQRTFVQRIRKRVGI